MLISKKNNKGFSLVEVIVSMLVLSIVISSVLTAFSLSAKSNAKTKKLQAAESMMEDLLELAGAVKDSSQYAGTVATTFVGTKTVSQPLSATETVEISQISGVHKGSYSFDIEISRDTKPSDYDSVNNVQVISFGEGGSHSVLVDASLSGNRFNPTDTEIFYDTMVRNEYITLHNNEIDERNETRPTPLPKMDDAEVTAIIDRDVLLVAETVGTDKMRLVGYFSYKVPDDANETDDEGFILPVGTDRYLLQEIFRSSDYFRPGSAVAGAETIDNVYVLYSPCSWENTALANNVDVRIWDPDEVLDANVFLIYQEDTLETVDSTLVNLDWNTRFDATKNIKISFRKLGEPNAEQPHRVDVYCPAKVLWQGETVSNVTTHDGTIIPQSPDIRVEKLTITIKDAAGNELASDSITCLQ